MQGALEEFIIESGKNGWYPLFERDWIAKACSDKKSLTYKEIQKAEILIKRFQRIYKTSDKYIIFATMDETDRTILIKFFLQQIEQRLNSQKNALN